MRNSRKRFLSSAIVLMLCISMFIGATFAWFTDSITSGGNIIKSGNLDIEMYWTDDLDKGTWYNVEDPKHNTIFGYDNWEPGYTEVRYIKIVNNGNLALNYDLTLAPQNGVGKLAEVINVYFADKEVEVQNREDLSKLGAIGLLNNVLDGGATASGTLLAANQSSPLHKSGEMIVTLAMNMITTAGNEYQGESVGDFTITALATQAPYEQDSFGSDYDTNAEMPAILTPGKVSANVTPDNGKVPTGGVNLSGEGISAFVPAGVAMKDGASKLTLSVTPLKNTTSDITVVNNEVLIPVDVHIEGIAEDNTVPIVIDLGEVLPKYMNMGNYHLFHVEDGATSQMTLVNDASELTAHNAFTYDPLTGEVSVAMASFSEVAMVANTENGWNGEYNYEWYDASKTELTIANADQFAAFGKIVGGMAEGIVQDTFENKTITLLCDINLADGEEDNDASRVIYPVGYYNYINGDEKNKVYVVDRANSTTNYDKVTSNVSAFKGTFNGNGHTIRNIYQNTWEMFGDYNDGYSKNSNYYKDAMGLFGYVNGGTIKNLTVDNFKSDGEFTPTGVIAAYAVNSTFENIAITHCNPRVYNTGNGGVVGIGGNSDDTDTKLLNFKNITVDNTNKISALWGSWDVACGGLMGMFRGNSLVNFTNCHVAAQVDVYNDVCGNYQYYWYRYSGMMIGSLRGRNIEKDGYTVPSLDGITATGCSVSFDTWNDYYYCELVDNSIASYTHDHQFSRLEEVKEVDVINKTYTPVGSTKPQVIPEKGRYNYVVVTDKVTPSTEKAECYHFVGGVQHKHESIGTEIVDGTECLVEDNQHIYLPFNQVFQGDGWGVKHIAIVGDEDTNLKTTYPGLDIEIRNRNTKEKFEGKFTGDFLYRVGNMNTISVGTLFEAIDGVDINDGGVWVTVEKCDESMNVSGTFKPAEAEKEEELDWTTGTIKFEGTGIVKVTIQDYFYCTPTTIYLEVVDAYNRTTATFSGNSVLLNDVNASSTLSTSGTLYGNGFTINMENAPISEKNGAVFHLYDGAVLKNVGIVGKEFTTVSMNVNDTNYGVSAVRAWGTVVIENSYISGCRSAVSVTGNELTIKDSVIANGVYANVDFRSGVLNLHNVTTINEPHMVNGTTVVGLGIVGNMTASAGRQLNITGTLNQYNWVSKADCGNIKAAGVDTIYNSVFTDSKYAGLRATYNNTTYVNTGILSLCSDFGVSAVNGCPNNYGEMDVTATISQVTVDGYVWAPTSVKLTADDMKYHDSVYTWTSLNQGSSYIPSAFDYNGAGLTAEDNVVQIEYESGNSYTLSADALKKLLQTTKYCKELDCKITMNNEDYTGKDIVIDGKTSQTYTIKYTVTDNLIYDKTGKITGNSYNIVKELKVFATVIDKGADAPTFTFYYGTKGSASAGTPHTTQPTNSYTNTIKKIGDTYYIMPNVNATSANAIGSKSIDGTIVYYPIIDGINVRSGNSNDYDFTRYYPVFKAVKISDNGTEYSYSVTKEMPATVAWVTAEIDNGNGASSINDGFGLYNNQYLCKIQKKAGDAESGGTSVIKFSYTALDGNTYYYYVGYRFYDENEGCVTPDTLITLADGSQVRVDSLTGNEQLLVWNMETGKLDSAPIMFVDSEAEKEVEVIKLYFSDGTEVKVISEHGFWDYDLNKYVYLDRYADKYIGHTFAKQDGDKLEKVTLVDVVLENQVTTAWSPVTAGHLCYFVNGMLSMPGGVGGLFNIFDVNAETMTYDYEAIAQDIETYGLFTYEELSQYVELPREMFDAAGGQYLKISIGKGNMTMDELINMIERYTKYF